MNPYLLKITANDEYSYNIRHDVVPYFYNQWHYHPEVELVHIVRGTGSRFIGDSVDTFNEGDLILIGSGLPHMMRNDDSYYTNEPGLLAESVTIHFLPELFGSFLSLPENAGISRMLEQAGRGVLIQGKTKSRVLALMDSIRFASKNERLILLMQLLNTIASDTDNQYITKNNSIKKVLNRSDESRLNRVYQYTLNNFAREITLKEIAAIVYMVPHSFCRYFKSRTKKRYSQFVLEVRVSQACKLLTETDYSIAVVCYESGFKNFSNFNRHFKDIVGKAPLEYRKAHHALKQ